MPKKCHPAEVRLPTELESTRSSRSAKSGRRYTHRFKPQGPGVGARIRAEDSNFLTNYHLKCCR